MEQFSALQSQASAREDNLRKELAQVREHMRRENQQHETQIRELFSEIETLKQENGKLAVTKFVQH